MIPSVMAEATIAWEDVNIGIPRNRLISFFEWSFSIYLYFPYYLLLYIPQLKTVYFRKKIKFSACQHQTDHERPWTYVNRSWRERL